MARARRAKARPARIVVPVAVIALLAGVVLAVQQGWFGGREATTASTVPTVMATVATADPTGSSGTSTSAEASATPSDTPSSETSSESSSPSDEGTAAAGAERALAACQAGVRARDDVIEAASTGVGHWSEHVQAQADVYAGKISTEAMDDIFKRTRLAGPDDVRRYEEAVSTSQDSSTDCEPISGAPTEISDQLESCQQRSEAQQPVLKAGADGMDDWKSHLADMRRSRMHHVDDAQGVWLRAWRAAPGHIKAYQQASEEFDAPKC
jgi:hypothetical protein